MMLDITDQIRAEAQARSPGTSPQQVVISGLRIPPPAKAALLAANQLRFSWPNKGWPQNPEFRPGVAIGAEIERDLAILADELSRDSKPDASLARYLRLLAEASTALADAYAKRVSQGKS